MPEPITQEEFLFEAQQALDELSAEELLSFPLVARKIEARNNNLYTIYFHDTRFHSLVIRWRRGQSFRLEFRDAMLRWAHSRGWRTKKKNKGAE
jgi:hypothetical protein